MISMERSVPVDAIGDGNMWSNQDLRAAPGERKKRFRHGVLINTLSFAVRPRYGLALLFDRSGWKGKIRATTHPHFALYYVVPAAFDRSAIKITENACA
jgi:hypothetical protein